MLLAARKIVSCIYFQPKPAAVDRRVAHPAQRSLGRYRTVGLIFSTAYRDAHDQYQHDVLHLLH